MKYIKLVISSLFLLLSTISFSQTYTIDQGGTVTTCSGDFYDSGNSGADYQNNENETITFCTATAGQCLIITFQSFDVENNFDELFVYDGPSTASPLVATLTGNTIPNNISSTSGCITLKFESDGSVAKSGWEATISCAACPTCTDGIQNGSEQGIDCGGPNCPACPGAICATANIITSLPFIGPGLTTQGSGNDYSSTDACGSIYMNGNDYVFEYTPLTDTCVDIILSNTGSYTGLFLMDGCPDQLGTNCIASDEQSGGNPSILDFTLLGGTTYYIVISTWPTPDFTPFDITIISEPCPTCTDGIQNGDELDIDCGGANCTPCPPTVQDCLGAIPLCQNVYSETNAYSGTGIYPDEINSTSSCLGSGEKNDVWYIFTVQQAGNLCFSITPNVLSDDYDWAVYDLTNNICSDIYTDPSLEVSCNFSGVSGVTGPNGLGGAQNEACIPLALGKTMVLNVSQFTSSTNGYTIDFSATTAQIFDNTNPEITSVITNCDKDSLFLTFSEQLICAPIDVNTFTIQSNDGISYSVQSIYSDFCNAGSNYDNQFTIITSPNLAPGNYALMINDTIQLEDKCGNNFLLDTNGFAFIIPDYVDFTTNTPVCVDDTVVGTEAIIEATGGITPYIYSLDGIQQNSNIFSNLKAPREYEVIVTDSLGCADTNVFITFFAENVIASNDTSIVVNESAQIFASHPFPLIYEWTPNQNLSCNDCYSPIATPFETTEYQIILTDSNGCTSTDYLTIEILIPDLFIPTGFSPNGDGYNDVVFVRSLDINTMTLQIFDRWGGIVFETSDQKVGWDGTFKGKELDFGVYVYKFEATLLSGKEIKQSGSITLFR